MRSLLLIILLSLTSTWLYGQTWKLDKVSDNEKYPYEYWLTFEHNSQNQLVKDSVSIVEPIVYQINSKEKLTDLEKEDIKFCIMNNPEEYNLQCSNKKKFQIYMHI